MGQWNPLVHKPPRPLPPSPTERLAEIAAIIEAVDHRCMAADGPVTPTLREMTQKEISRIYKLAALDVVRPSTTPHPSDGLSDAEIARAEDVAEGETRAVNDLLLDHQGVRQALGAFALGDYAVPPHLLRALALAGYAAGQSSVADERVARLETGPERALDDLRMVAAVLADAGVPERSGKAANAAPWHIAHRVRILADRRWQPEPFPT